MTSDFIHKFIHSIENKEFIKITLSKPTEKSNGLENIYGKLIELKKGLYISFTYRYKMRDEVKNIEINLCENFLKEQLGLKFLAADLMTTTQHYSLKFNKKREAQLFEHKEVKPMQAVVLQHNKEKKRYIQSKNNLYLEKLGIVTKNGEIIKSKEDKFRQINKFIEILDNQIKEIRLDKTIKIVDMGSGKGYLTFAVYDYLKNSLGLNVNVLGIETQEKLVNICNSIAQESGFEFLYFKQSNINDFNESDIDILISLHACDTATDDTLHKGILSNTRLIISSPCCHKQVREQMNKSKKLLQINKFGILRERQAELITDSIRALLLEKQGYKTNIIEFISSEYTGKNLLIIASKSQAERDKEKLSAEIEELKKLFGIEYQYLEKLLEGNENDQSWRNLNPVCHVH